MWLRSLLLLIAFLCDHLPQSQAEICTNATCTYHLVIDYGWTMKYKDNASVVHDVTLNGTSLQYVSGSEIHTVSPNDVITADGYPRRILTVNGQYPGPPIEVVEGAQVVVRVTNNLPDYSASIHFHGIRQLKTWYMDGASLVTMCPIPPGGSFEHRFVADPVGTHWYHEHYRLVYADGLYGMFIVYPKNDIPSSSAPDFLVTIGDWYHEETAVIYSKNKHVCGNGAVGASLKPANFTVGCTVDGVDLQPSLYESALFGGRGRWDDRPFPLTQYTVTQGSTRRFRVVHSGFWFPLQVSIDGHPLRIVASDGGPLQPIVVDSFDIMPGERVDFEVDANQSPDRYWIRARPPCVDDEARAVLVYDTATTSGSYADPVTNPSPCTASSPCTVFNCPFARYPDGSNRTCVTMGDAHSTLTDAELQEEFGVGDPDSQVLTYHLNFGMVVGGSINARRFSFPAVPYFLQKPPPCSPVPCVDGCNCRCTHTLTLPYNRTVQFVVSYLQPNNSIMDAGTDNVHFHGHKYAVMSMGFPEYDPISGHITKESDDLSCQNNELCWNATWSQGRVPSFQNVTKPPIKDTTVIPKSGYVVLRFRTTNPGPFMLHCHIDSHVLEGMAMIIDIAPEQRPPPPPGFPTCLPAEYTTATKPRVTTTKPQHIPGKCKNYKGLRLKKCRRANHK